MSTFDELKKRADELVEKAKTTVGDLADQQGDKVAGAVDKVTDTIDEKTGGSASAVTARMDGAVAGALTVAQTTTSTVSQKAAEATNAVKDAVTRKPDRT